MHKKTTWGAQSPPPLPSGLDRVKLRAVEIFFSNNSIRPGLFGVPGPRWGGGGVSARTP